MFPYNAERQAIADRANEALRGCQSRLGCPPVLTWDSPFWLLLDWLVFNDPNGSYTNERRACDDLEPLTRDEAWKLVDEASKED